MGERKNYEKKYSVDEWTDYLLRGKTQEFIQNDQQTQEVSQRLLEVGLVKKCRSQYTNVFGSATGSAAAALQIEETCGESIVTTTGSQIVEPCPNAVAQSFLRIISAAVTIFKVDVL